MAELNLVETTVTIAGQKVHFARMHLIQKFNAHHRIEIEIDFEEFGPWMEDPVPIIRYIGEDLNVTMQHRQTGEQNLFKGVITNVSFSGYHGQQNSVIITGASPTIKLDGTPAMDSFMDLPLQQVVDEAVANSGNGGSVTVKPKFGSKLDYVCQYNESCFDFLNRLSWQFGEWFFYDGLDTYFGMKRGDSATLEYDKEMTYFDLSANLVPQKFTRLQYLHHDDKEIDTDDPSDVPGVRGYLQVALDQSKAVYTSEAYRPLLPDINTKKDLDDLVKAEKSRVVGEMLIMRGKTQTCKVKIGSRVKIRLPERMNVTVKSVDTFL
ncbi:MAG: phage late control D family protein, partial [Candidatus Symbiothrix sp.]|nr:phage late control D family protein [Candidatus Symbiothrix sp.]